MQRPVASDASRYDYARAGLLRRAVRLAVTSRAVAWLSIRMLPGLDRLVYRATRSRMTFSAWASGLPVVVLTTTGARTGRARDARVLAIPDGDGLVVIAANFGQSSNPAWYHNLRADPHVSVTSADVRREYHARELSGAERDRQFARAVTMNPGWQRYPAWAGERTIPVIRLRPADSAASP